MDLLFCYVGSSRCNVGSTIMPLCWVRTALEASEEEGTYAFRFSPLAIFYIVYIYFTPRDFAQFNWHSRFFLWILLTRRQNFLIQKYFHSITSLTWTVALYLFAHQSFSQESISYPLQSTNINTNTHLDLKKDFKDLVNTCQKWKRRADPTDTFLTHLKNMIWYFLIVI